MEVLFVLLLVSVIIDCSKYLFFMSCMVRIPSTLLLIETSSYDTIGNAFWARTSHIDVRGWSDLLIITSSFHMDRTKQIFDWVFALPSDAAAQTVQKTVETTEPHTDSEHTTMRKSTVGRFRLTYVEASDEGLSPEMIKTRREKEQKSLETVKELEQQVQLVFVMFWFTNCSQANVCCVADSNIASTASLVVHQARSVRARALFEVFTFFVPFIV
jgi:hypothetical protein